MCNCSKCQQQQQRQQEALVPELETLFQELEYELSGEYGFEAPYETQYEDEYEYEGPVAPPPVVAPPVLQPPKSTTIWKANTDLGACFGGNFNFLYNAGASEATITFNTKMRYKAPFTDAQKRAIEKRLEDAGEMWNRSAEIQIRDNKGVYSHSVKLNFKVKIVTNSKNMNKETEVFAPGTRTSIAVQKGRETVNWDLNVFINSPIEIIAHELGHVWGLGDEYRAGGVRGWFQMKLPCHVGKNSPLLNDTKSVMNDQASPGGGEFRTRHFLHFGRTILNAFWNDPKFVSPIVQNNRTVAKRIIGRVVLLKRELTGGTPYTTNQPYNPVFEEFQVSRR